YELGGVRFFAANRTTVGVANVGDSEIAQLVQVGFHKSGIFVQFPYIGETAGLIGSVTAERTGENEASFSFAKHGRVTPTLVKYSHPLDGNAHFSQDGKILTQVWRKSFPLTQEGRVFELTASFPLQFKTVRRRTAKAKRLYVPFVFTDGVSQS